MVKIQPLEAPEQNYSMEYLYYYYYLYYYDYLYYDDYLDDNLEKITFEEYFYGDWRQGQEISKIVITKRFYQISSSSTQA